MYLSDKTSRVRMLEAQNARKNRLEIVRALSTGQITKRDLLRWGLFTATGLLAAKNGLSPYARSAYAAVPTGTPPSPVPPGLKFRQPMPRLELQTPLPLHEHDDIDPVTGRSRGTKAYEFLDPVTLQPLNTPYACCTSYHTYWNDPGYRAAVNCTNPVSNMGPMEGRPPLHVDSGKDYFAHQRWSELPPKVGYLMSLGQVTQDNSQRRGFGPKELGFATQDANSVWSFGSRYNRPLVASNSPSGLPDPTKKPGYYGYQTGSMTPPLLRVRYNEPVLCRIHNDLPVDRDLNNGFGRNEISTHYHNAHNGAESDGACNAYHFPGTFYDYHWSGMLARHDFPSYFDKMDSDFKTNKALQGSWTPSLTTKGGKDAVQGDDRELQGTMWFHDHRFFFTAENVHKGNFGMVNMYSGKDRGHEQIDDGVNLRLPSGTAEDWGNLDYDVNLAVSNPALDQHQQLFFDIFDTDGFLGDILAVNGAYYPFMEVKARRYRFRILNASMSRFIKLALVDETGKPVPFYCIANDGNFLPKPVPILDGILDQQGVAERFDIVVDFSRVPVGVGKIYLVNVLQQTDGRKPDGPVSIGQAMRGISADPAVGKILEFRIGAAAPDASANFWDDAEWSARGKKFLTQQIPVQAPARTRTIEFVRSNGDSRKTATGQCIPECGNVENFPWSIKVNGQAAHSLNASRIGALIPGPGEIEHWTLVNGGGGWDHPIHLHFEEGITMDRGGDSVPSTELLARKDVWRLRPSGRVRFQVRFGEFGGSYVNHCHNTVHEDFAMLLRYQLKRDAASGTPQSDITPTPVPDYATMTVKWVKSEVLPEGDPSSPSFSRTSGGGGGTGGGSGRSSSVSTSSGSTAIDVSTSTSSGGGSGGGGGGAARPLRR